MNIHCPHCHSAVDTLKDDSWSEIVCPSCGSSFSLVSGDSTRAHRTDARVLGHFELLEEVGIGKFGSVWKARDTKLQRTVAVKIPRRNDLDPQQTELFFRDARAAAQLRHPRIAGVHEVGRDDDTVYIVTEFIEGANLKEWLTGQRLTVRQAATLVVKVAEALHHAHEAGVVHRDLKPSNIMMDLDGEPHVIDFGLARRETGEVTMTVAGQVLGTPAYMSPEQARGEGHEADRRADIYSLGVVLFELLTNELPFRGEPRMLIVQILRDEPPSPRRLNGGVPRDLETITLKCLQKEPARRYATAQSVADDLKRCLAGEPIHARPVGQIERSWRWVRRNRSVAISATALVVALLGLAAVSTVAAVRINAARREAVDERDQAEEARRETVAEKDRAEGAFRQARRAVDDSFTAISENKLVNVPGLQPLRKELLQNALKYYEGFLHDRQDDLSLQAELASTYYRVGQIRFILGELADSELSYRRALGFDTKLVRANPNVPEYKSRLAGSYNGVAILEGMTGRLSDAEKSHRGALVIREQLVRDYPSASEYQGQVAGSYVNLATLERDTGRLVEAEASNKRALEIYAQLLRENPADPQYQNDLALSYNNLANIERDTGRLAEAEASHGKALEIRENLALKNPSATEYRSALARSYRNLAILQTDTGRLAEAEASNGKALEIYAQLARENPAVPQYESDLAFTYSNMGNLKVPDRPGQIIQQRDPRRLTEAEASYQRAVEIQEKLARENPTVLQSQSDLASTYTNHGNLQRLGGRLSQAKMSYQKALAIFEKLARENPAVLQFQSDLAFNYTNVANLHRLGGRLAEAETLYQKALAVREKLAWENSTVPEYQNELAWSYNRLAATLQLAGRSADAERTYRQAIEQWETQGTSQTNSARRERALAVLYSQLAKQIALADGDWESVSQAMQKAASLAPQDEWVQAACGDAAALLSHWREGADAYRRAMEASDHSWHMLVMLGMLELAAGNDSAYRVACRDIVSRHGQNENHVVDLGILFVCALGEDAVEDWEPLFQLAHKIIAAEPANPLARVGLGAPLYLAGRPAEAVKVLASAVPQHALLMIVVPDQKDSLLQSQLMGETYLTLAYRDLGMNAQAKQARQRAEQIISRMEHASPVYDEFHVLWANRYAAYISRRKLKLFFDPTPVKTEVSSPPVDSGGQP